MVRIPVDSTYIEGALQKARESKLPPELRVRRTNIQSINPQVPVDTLSLSENTTAPKELKLHPEIPTSDNIQSNLEQTGDTFLTIAILIPQLAKLALSAQNEQKILVGATI